MQREAIEIEIKVPFSVDNEVTAFFIAIPIEGVGWLPHKSPSLHKWWVHRIRSILMEYMRNPGGAGTARVWSTRATMPGFITAVAATITMAAVAVTIIL
jgi:uncharacterized heparinase superfamily protein